MAISFNIDLKNKTEKAPFLLAVSGGMDSMVMLEYFQNYAKTMGLSLGVAHVNYNQHHLSDSAEKIIRNFCNEQNIAYFVRKFEKCDLKGSFEDIARKFRYNYFNDLCKKYGFNTICTAHHREDQIETLFMKQIQGADTVTYSGIREFRGKIWRPFLRFHKEQLIKYALDNEIFWIDDPTNSDHAYLRNKIREIDLPKAISSNSNLINDLFLKKKKSDDLISKIKVNFTNKLDENKIEIKIYENHPVVIFYNLLDLSFTELKLFIHFSFNEVFKTEFPGLTRSHWKTFQQFIHQTTSGNEFKIFDSYIIENDRKKFRMFNEKEFRKLSKSKIKSGENCWINGSFIVKSSKLKDDDQRNLFVVSQKDWVEGLYIRHWECGDRIPIFNSIRTKKLSNVFKDRKLSNFEKRMQPIIVDKMNNPVWLPGIRHSSCFKVPDGNKKKYLRWKPI